MKNISVLKTGIDVSKIVEQLNKNPSDWGSQKGIDNTEIKDPHQYITSVDVLQLVMGGITESEKNVGNTEICIKTPAYDNHTEIVNYLSKRFPTIYRCGFLALPVGEIVGAHIDEGTYYQDKDRYHLSIEGQYEYIVGNERITVDPGTLLWFNNKIPHGTVNLGDVTRITFVFDVPQQ
tara:strand:- start:587 stop:1120 length:534 start_codon:yes stop_codon:yes gene_type:complete